MHILALSRIMYPFSVNNFLSTVTRELNSWKSKRVSYQERKTVADQVLYVNLSYCHLRFHVTSDKWMYRPILEQDRLSFVK
jgi:hypothetical protein